MPDAKLDGATPESRLFEDLGFDSVGLMMLAMSLEDEFNVRFDEAINFYKVKDVIDYLEKHSKK